MLHLAGRLELSQQTLFLPPPKRETADEESQHRDQKKNVEDGVKAEVEGDKMEPVVL